jgi:MoaA/NifB/PqqE/SkfB family radical SAM enzyme
MTADVLRRALSNIMSCEELQVQEITFNWRGEPLMNKQFVELLEILLVEVGDIPVQFHTNAMLISPRIAEELVSRVGAATIYLSIDGGSKLSHEHNRGGDTFDRAVQGGWNLIRARGDSKRPRVVLYQLDLREKSENYDREFLQLARQVDFWQRVRPVYPTGDHEHLANQEEEQGGSWAVGGWEEVRYEMDPPSGPCFWIGHAVCVDPRGGVSLCLLSKRGSEIGNLLIEPAAVILQRARLARQQVEMVSRKNFDHCRGCRKKEGDVRPPNAIPNLQQQYGG